MQKSFKRILEEDTPDINTKYVLGEEIGHGQFGTIYMATDKETGEKYACKSMLKRRMKRHGAVEEAKREIQVRCKHRAVTT